jgi:tetratricopeptide (TPR) repeat protein
LTLGRKQESLTQSELYIKADPLSSAAHDHLAWYYMLTGQYDLGIEQEMDALHYDPNYQGAVLDLAEIYRHKGMSQEALAQYERASALVGDNPASVQSLRRAFQADGWRGYGRESLQQNLKKAKQEYVSPYEIAWNYALLGDKENVLRYLEIACAEREISLTINTEKDFNFLHADPRYTSLLRRMGLPV